MSECIQEQPFICQTSYDSDGPQGHVARLFFGVAKRCKCRKCLDAAGEADIQRMVAKKLVPE